MSCSPVTSPAPANAAQHLLHLAAAAGAALQIVAIDLDADVGADAGDQLVHAHLDRLAERRPHARAPGRDSFAHLLGQLRLRARLLPLLARLEREEEVRQLDAHRVGGDLRGARAASRCARSRPGTPPAAASRCGRSSATASSTEMPGQPHGGADDGALAQLGQELAAHARGQQRRAGHQRQRRPAATGRATPQRQVQAPARRAGAPAAPATAPAPRPACGRNRLASTGVSVSARISEPSSAKISVSAIGLNSFPSTPSSVRMGRKTIRMMPTPNATGRATSSGAPAASRRALRSVSARPSSRWRCGQAAHGVLHHHHRAVHDEAEVDRAQAQQAGGDARLQHQVAGEEHRERNRHRHDQPGPQVAEEGEAGWR